MDDGSRSFFGRDSEIDLVRSSLGANRLVTVLGAPGVGKSALVARVGSRSARETFLRVDCTQVRTLSDVRRVVARGAESAEAFTTFLIKVGKPVVVLDEADALGDEVPAIAKAVLAASREVRVLVSSRERLRLAGEAVVHLSPLDLPEETSDPDEAGQSTAMALFVARAKEADARFRLDRESTPIASRIVRALEGLPLSIELAAARLAVLDLATLESAVLSGTPFEDGTLDVPERARSLEASLRPSLTSLDPKSLRALGILAQFPSVFSLESALVVLGGRGTPEALSEATRLLETLREKSLVDVDSPSGSRGKSIRMLRAVRDAALARGTADDVDAYVTRLAGLAVVRVQARGGPIALARTNHGDEHVESSGFVRGFELARELGNSVAMAELALGTSATFLGKGPLARFEEMLGEALTRESTLVPELRADLRLARGQARLSGGRRDASVEDFELARSEGSRTTRAIATSKLALVRGLSGRASEAHALFDEARELLGGVDRPDIEGRLHKDRANVYAEEGRDEAYGELLSAKASFERSHEPRESAFVSLLLGTRHCDDGKLELSRRACDDSIELFREVGDERSVGWALTILGLVEQESRAFGMARERFSQAGDIARKVGDHHTEGLIEAYFAGLELELGEVEEAVAKARAAVREIEAAGDKHGTAVVLAILAVGLHKLGRSSEAHEPLARARAAAAEDGREARRIAVELLSLTLAQEIVQSEVDALVEGKKLVEELRFALRIVAKGRGSTERPRISEELVVGPSHAWVRTPTSVVELAKRPVLRRLFQALAKERASAPGKPVPATKLVRLMWPNEKIVPRAAMNRLYVAVTRLREEGLGPALAREGDGYLLRSDVAIRAAKSGESR